MTEQERNGVGEALGDALGCLLPFLLMLALFVGVPLLVFRAAGEKAGELAEVRCRIEGRVASVEATHVEREKLERGVRIIVGDDGTGDRLVVTFEDGRKKSFSGTSAKPIEKGRYYVITYNGGNQIIDVEEKDEEAEAVHGR